MLEIIGEPNVITLLFYYKQSFEETIIKKQK